jgi:hypothetical protein
MSEQQESGMVAVPPQPPAGLDDLKRWDELKKEIARLTPTALILQEKELRARIVASFFPNPKEGTNAFPLANGYRLKFVNSIKREVDNGEYQARQQEFMDAKIPAASLLVWKPTLDKKQYNTLTAEQQAIFDRCLIVKPESPQLEIELPAAAKKKQEAVAAMAAAHAQGVVPGNPQPGVQL